MVSQETATAKKTPTRQQWRYVLLVPFWVLAAFVAANVLIFGLFQVLIRFGVPFSDVNASIFNTFVALLTYGLTIGIVIGVPYLLWRRLPTRTELGIDRLPSWMDILVSPGAFIVYLLVSGGLLFALQSLLPGLINYTQTQDVGFTDLSYQFEYIAAFLTLVVMAPLAEELLFRGYLYGKLRIHVPAWASILAASVLFGLLHLIGSSENGQIQLQWNVVIDTFIFSLALCTLREFTGSIWAGVLLHMIKNGVAFYFLFINTSLLSTLGG